MPILKFLLDCDWPTSRVQPQGVGSSLLASEMKASSSPSVGRKQLRPEIRPGPPRPPLERPSFHCQGHTRFLSSWDGFIQRSAHLDSHRSSCSSAFTFVFLPSATRAATNEYLYHPRICGILSTN